MKMTDLSRPESLPAPKRAPTWFQAGRGTQSPPKCRVWTYPADDDYDDDDKYEDDDDGDGDDDHDQTSFEHYHDAEFIEQNYIVKTTLAHEEMQ